MSLRERWNTLTGDSASFTMENRAFNFVSAASFLMCLAYLVVDVFFGYYGMAAVCGVLMLLLGFFYYLSRCRKNYHAGLVMYGVFSYIALILNYFDNSGITGPTLFIFFVTFTALIAITSSKRYGIWFVLHIVVVTGLLGYEYMNPDAVPMHYNNRAAKFADVAVTYLVAIIFIFIILRYLKDYHERERQLAESRAAAIKQQHEQILEQNKELQRLNDQKNRLFSILSHDLRGPIDSIRGYLVLLSEKLLREDEREDLEAELLEQTKYTSNLLLNLLSWTKAQMSGASVTAEPIQLKILVEEAIQEQIGFAAKKNIKLTAGGQTDMEAIGDHDMMRIVLRNLLNNAIKFTKPGGEIAVKSNQRDGEVIISVADSGIGIPKEQQDSIFTLNTRSTYGTRNEKGIGLGLTMCREFMESQHGRIWFESFTGAGTVFYVSLPGSRI